MKLHKGVKRDNFCSSWTMQSQKNDLQLYNYNHLEPCLARIIPTSGSPMVPTNNKENKRSPVIRGETAADFGAKSAAKAQPVRALPGFIRMSVLQ